MRGLLRSPLHGPLSGRLLLLHVTGRTSGKVYDIPVGYHDLDGQMTVLTSSAWRANVWGGADVEVTLRGRRRRARAVLVEDPDTVAGVYRARIKDLGP